MSAQSGEMKDSLVVCHSSQGVEIRAGLLRLAPYRAVFEVYNPNLVLQNSEVLGGFKVIINERPIYAGRAVVASLVNTGMVVVCEAKLDEGGVLIPSLAPGNGTASLRDGFEEFLGQWQKLYKMLPEFKVVVADMHTFLSDLRLWLDQVELQIRSAPSSDRAEMEQNAVREIGAAVVPAFDCLHERLESLSESIDEDLRPVHQNFSKRQLHSLVMCSPFAYRTYHKPLGYAGDYEMVNMILRDAYEGGSLFAKVVNLWFLSQWPAKAHRNRIDYLRNLLLQESRRGACRGRPIRVLNLGCGPAGEIQQFLREEDVSNYAQFTLLDFNEETIQHTTRILNDLKQRHDRRTGIQILKKSVHQVLKEGARSIVQSPDKNYDLIYCAGLFDYLPDRSCKQLMNIFYDWLAPGGLLAATNVDDTKPFRNMLEFVLDWHLIYRDTDDAAKLLPDAVHRDEARIARDDTTVNLFIEVRKEGHE
jgi:extracellular factor (EF) 3-hydroxypalmitic acid methyl ester biosynthesis protein